MERNIIMLSALFKSIIDQDTDPVVICDPDSVIVYMNPASIRRYRKDLTGRNLSLCHTPESAAKIQRVLNWFRESPDHNRIFTTRVDRENADVYMVALRSSEGTLIGYYEKHERRDPDTAPFYDF